MKKAILLGAAAAFAVIAGTGAALTADPAQPDWFTQATDTATNLAEMTSSDVKNMMPVTSGSFADLLHIDETSTVIAPTVSREIIGTQSIRKIGFGHETSVQIVTTPSGVYSSDGIASSHVLYPGIKGKPAANAGLGVLFALTGGKWHPLVFTRAGSFVHYGPGYLTNGSTTCFSGKGYFGCI